MILESMAQGLKTRERIQAYKKADKMLLVNVDPFSFYVTRFCFVAIAIFLLATGFVKFVIPYLVDRFEYVVTQVSAALN